MKKRSEGFRGKIKNSNINKYLNRYHTNYGYTDKISQIDYQLSKQFDLYFNREIEKKNFLTLKIL